MKELVKKGLKILVIFTKGNEKDRYTRTSIYIPSNKLEWQFVLQLQQKSMGISLIFMSEEGHLLTIHEEIK